MFDIIKYHKTENGETSSAVKYDTMEEALRNYHQFASNYMADDTVRAWGLAIVDVSNGQMRMVKRDSYAKPLPEVVEDEMVVS